MADYGAPDPWAFKYLGNTPSANTPVPPAGQPYETPIPGAAIYAQASNAAKLAYQQALARINQRRGDTLRQYGYVADIDPKSGTVKNMRVDANNPYGQYQQIRLAHGQADAAARHEGIARGLGSGGGLAAQIRARVHQGFGADDSAMGQALTGTLADLQDQQTSAASIRDAALYQAQLDQLNAALQAEAFNTPDYSGLDYPDYGDDTLPSTANTNKVLKAAKKAPVKKYTAPKSGYAPGGVVYKPIPKKKKRR